MGGFLQACSDPTGPASKWGTFLREAKYPFFFIAGPADPAYNLTGKTLSGDIPMRSAATTKMSSKGQVVIPEEIRKQLGLDAGTQFVVVAEDDVVILKMVRAPSMKEFDRLIRKARAQAKAAGLKRADISAAVSDVRKRR
jgi:AbrB family looped-hinge helix DNA binding protein